VVTGTEIRPAADPVTGWRYWQLRPGTTVLRSVTHKGFAWTPGRPLRATCRGGGHPAPAEGCSCGIYGSADLASLREHGVCLVPGALVVGRVALWGKVVADEHGYRGEYAYPATLLVVGETVPAGSRPGVLEGLAAYGVTVGDTGAEEAVGGISRTILAFQAMSGGTGVT
jgi:hypothetical protein